jgi:glycine cleavage system regulatory protein
MAHLAGQFAGILRIEVPSAQVEAVREALSKLEPAELRITVVAADASLEDTGLRSLRLHLIGQDRPGIVREIAQVLASRGVNVEELQTECQPAPMSGELLFVANARLGVPEHLKLEQLQEALERIASDLMVDITLEPQKGA